MERVQVVRRSTVVYGGIERTGGEGAHLIWEKQNLLGAGLGPSKHGVSEVGRGSRAFASIHARLALHHDAETVRKRQ